MRPRPTSPIGALARGVLAVVALAVAAVTTNGVWAAFTEPGSIPSNDFTTGWVALSDDDNGSAMMAVADMKPGDSQSTCIRVTYTGSHAASVHLYGTTTGTGLDQYLTLTVTRGSISGGSFDDCTNFTADASAAVLFDGTLRDYPDAYAGAVADPTPGWASGESHAYRFTVTLQDNSAAQGLNASQQFTWQARS